MKFVLKVLVLVCLVVMSKLDKDESMELPKQIASKTEPTSVFTSNIRETPVVERQSSAISVKFEKGSLQIN